MFGPMLTGEAQGGRPAIPRDRLRSASIRASIPEPVRGFQNHFTNSTRHVEHFRETGPIHHPHNVVFPIQLS